MAGLGDALYEVFPGTPELRDGYLWPNDRPGFGVDIDEARAARTPGDVEPISIDGLAAAADTWT